MNMKSGEYDEIALETIGEWSAFDSGEGRTYYYNKKTKESTWTAPEKFTIEDPEILYEEEIQLTAHDIQGLWSCHESDEGDLYYFNRLTKHSSWKKPMDYKLPIQLQLQYARDKLVQMEREEQEKIREEELKKKEKIKQKKALEEKNHAKAKATEEFKQMLRERKITHAATFAQVLPRIQYDKRYSAVDGMDVRRSIFEQFKQQQQQADDQQGMLALAKLLASSVAKEKLNENSTLPGFVDSLDTELKKTLKAKISKVQPQKLDELFAKRLSILKQQRQKIAAELSEARKAAAGFLKEVVTSVNANTKQLTDLQDKRWNNTILNQADQKELLEEHVQKLKAKAKQNQEHASSGISTREEARRHYLELLQKIVKRPTMRWREFRSVAEEKYPQDYDAICSFFSSNDRHDTFDGFVDKL